MPTRVLGTRVIKETEILINQLRKAPGCFLVVFVFVRTATKRATQAAAPWLPFSPKGWPVTSPGGGAWKPRAFKVKLKAGQRKGPAQEESGVDLKETELQCGVTVQRSTPQFS